MAEIVIKDGAECVRDGEWVMLKLASERSMTVKADKTGTVEMGKYGRFRGSLLIGCAYERVYCLSNDQLERVEQIAADTVDSEIVQTNQCIYDTSAAQKLTVDQIHELRLTKQGGEIISEIISNHQQFDLKTPFSKQKYIKRKCKRFLDHFRVVRIDIAELAEHSFLRNPASVRIDMLSLILCAADARAGARILLADDFSGLLAAGVLGRMDGHGALLTLHERKLDFVKFMNFTESQLRPLRSISYDAPLGTETFSSLIIASSYDPKSVFDKVSNKLVPSSPIAIFSPSQSCLHELFLELKQDPRFVLVNLSTPWFRPYQILEGRTHPLMRVNDSGGALLTATKVSGDAVPSSMQPGEWQRYCDRKSLKRPREPKAVE